MAGVGRRDGGFWGGGTVGGSGGRAGGGDAFGFGFFEDLYEDGALFDGGDFVWDLGCQFQDVEFFGGEQGFFLAQAEDFGPFAGWYGEDQSLGGDAIVYFLDVGGFRVLGVLGLVFVGDEVVKEGLGEVLFQDFSGGLKALPAIASFAPSGDGGNSWGRVHDDVIDIFA